MTLVPTILGFGHKVPDSVRGNDDPIFSYLNELREIRRRKGEDAEGPFYGYETRHVLGRLEKLTDIMKPAAEEALSSAVVKPEDIDVLLGCASVSQHIVPSDLYELHRELKLPPTTLAVPLGNDFSNFSVALKHADALIRAERARNVLIAIGGSWSRAVDYQTVQAFSAGDGAAAVVVGRRTRVEAWQSWTVVDEQVLIDSKYFGSMYLADVFDPNPTNITVEWPFMPRASHFTPRFHITPAGAYQYLAFGRDRAWQPAVTILQRRGISSTQVTLIGHQSSDALTKEWEKKIRPGHFFQTTKHYANMTVATIPVNLALAVSPEKQQDRDAMGLKEVSTPYVLLLSLGADMHAHALLLGKVGSIPT